MGLEPNAHCAGEVHRSRRRSVVLHRHRAWHLPAHPDVLAGAKPIWRLPRSFSVCPSNLRRRETFGGEQFFLGTCSYPDRLHWANDYGPGHPPQLTEQQSRELEADLVARLGMQVVRIGPLGYWFDEAKPIDFERADACVQTLADRGLKLALQLGTGSNG